MRHKRRLIGIGVAALMLVSLCAVCASTGVTAATGSGGTQASSQAKLTDIVGAPPGGLLSAPAVCSWGPGRLDVFARAGPYDIWHTWFDGTWHSWESIGTSYGGITSAPTAVSWGEGRIDVFARGAAGELVHKWFDHGWSGWEYLYYPAGRTIDIHTSPTACSWGANRLDIFITDNLGQIQQKWFDGTWHDWYNLGRPTIPGLTGSPGAVSTVSWGYQRVDIFVRGGDGALWQLWYDGAWQPWHRFDDTAGVVATDPVTASGGNTAFGTYWYAPTVSSWGANRLDVFFAQTSGHLLQKWFNGNWQPLYQPGSSKFFMAASPSAVAWQNAGTTRIDIFTRSTTFELYQLYYAGGWHGWYSLNGIS